MNISRQWLEAFLRQPIDARDAAERLAMLGAPVDAIERVGPDLSPFVVGLVTDVRPHPNADKLQVTTVDDGSGTMFSVVCGAPNVTAGHRYPFARLGTVMPGGLVIEKRKLRGEASEGMLCSARELGLGQEHDGLLTLDTDAAAGTPLTAVIRAGDERLVLDVTPNRADLLGHKGVARELATSYGASFRLPEVPVSGDIDVAPPERVGENGATGGVRITIDDRTGCPRFLAGVVRGVTIGPSPEWLRQRIESVGLRSINNVVDVTNYIMLELNQPMHAYDADTLHGSALGVRTSKGGETVVTLDGAERSIPAGALVIVDGERVIGLAGIMGGRDTEVSDRTANVVLECAAFDSSRVRQTRRALGMSTDASQRFERGTDRWGAVDAFRRAMKMLVGVAGGRIDGPTLDCFPAATFPPRIFLRPSRVAQVLGLDLEWREIERCLVAIGATVVSKPDDARIAVDVPGWRPDLVAEIDLIEEVARIHGYEAIPTAVRAFRPGTRADDPAWGAAARVRRGLASLGLSEVMTLPMVSSDDPDAPRVLNPVSADHGAMRTALVPSLLREVQANWAAQTADIRLFEIGTVFRNAASGPAPDEAVHVAFAVTGARAPAHWTRGGTAPAWDRWDARGLFEAMVALADRGGAIQVEGDGWLASRADGTVLGRCGAGIADAPPWAATVFVGEVMITPATSVHPKYRPLPKFPAVTRDLALVLPSGGSIAAATALLETRGSRHNLTSVSVVDEYRGAELANGARSVTVRLVFRHAERTLTDGEVEQALLRLRTSLERELDISIRTS